MNIKKILSVFVVISLVALFTSCSGGEDSLDSTDLSDDEAQEMSRDTESEETEEPTEAQSTEETATEETPPEESSSDDYLEKRTEVNNYFYSYQISGNLASIGYVLFDRDEGRHIISMGQGVYSFDPDNGELEILFKLEESGSAEYLNSSNEWLYYINSYDGQALRRKKNDYTTVDIVHEGKATYMSKHDNYILALTEGESYSELYRYNENDETTMMSNLNHLSNMTSYYTTIFYYPKGSIEPNAYRVADFARGGKTTLTSFDDRVVEIESVLAYGQFDFALVLKEEGSSGVYIYNGSELIHSITTEEGFSDFSSINYDGNKFYFIADKGDGRWVYTLDKNTYDLEKSAPIPNDASNLNIINNWMYLQRINTSEVYQLAPGKSEFQILHGD